MQYGNKNKKKIVCLISPERKNRMQISYFSRALPQQYVPDRKLSRERDKFDAWQTKKFLTLGEKRRRLKDSSPSCGKIVISKRRSVEKKCKCLRAHSIDISNWGWCKKINVFLFSTYF